VEVAVADVAQRRHRVDVVLHASMVSATHSARREIGTQTSVDTAHARLDLQAGK
jgi:hypothetical protein